MRTYALRDAESGVTEKITAASLNEARQQAEEWARQGDYNLDDGDETIWVRVYILNEDGENVESVKVAIDPPAPKCVDGQRDSHDWQSPHEIVGGIAENPGVWGHGGGVTVTECCVRCGCGRETDTWAQDMTDGEQGLRSVRFEPGAYVEALREAEGV
jgi:hypothetical protein